MDTVKVLERLAAIESKLTGIERELMDVATRQTEVSDFVNTMKEVFNEMAENPMFRAMGISPISTESTEVPRLPGMPDS